MDKQDLSSNIPFGDEIKKGAGGSAIDQVDVEGFVFLLTGIGKLVMVLFKAVGVVFKFFLAFLDN